MTRISELIAGSGLLVRCSHGALSPCRQKFRLGRARRLQFGYPCNPWLKFRFVLQFKRFRVLLLPGQYGKNAS